MLDVFFRAIEDLDQKRGRRHQPSDPDALDRHLRHLLLTDPRSCFVADDRGRVVAFGLVMVREGDAFLSFLFVLPPWQGRGLGRTIVAACLDGAGTRVRLATCAEADQPVSTGLYASLGLTPRELVFLLRGTLDEEALPQLPVAVLARPIGAEALSPSGAVSELDVRLLGYRRPRDHAFWAAGGRLGWLFEHEGGPFGYGYAHRSGRIGPVAAEDPDWLPAMLGYLVRSVPVREGRQAVVPGVATTALLPLLSAGLRLDGTPAVYCTDRPGPRLDRYLPMSFALL